MGAGGDWESSPWCPGTLRGRRKESAATRTVVMGFLLLRHGLLGPQQLKGWDHSNLGVPVSLCVQKPQTDYGFPSFRVTATEFQLGRCSLRNLSSVDAITMHISAMKQSGAGGATCGALQPEPLPLTDSSVSVQEQLEWSVPTGLIFHRCFLYCSPDGEKTSWFASFWKQNPIAKESTAVTI